MTIAQAVELVLGAGGVGGGINAVAKMTRVAVAVELLTEKIGSVIERQGQTDKTIAEHQSRLDKGGL